MGDATNKSDTVDMRAPRAAGSPAPAGSEIRIQHNPADGYRLIVQGLEWAYVNEYGGGEFFRTRFLWRAKLEAWIARRWLSRQVDPTQWKDIPNIAVSGGGSAPYTGLAGSQED